MGFGALIVFTQEVADAICDEIADGKSLREVCRQDGMPDKTTVLRWLSKDDAGAFRTQYARACEERGIALAEDSLVEARSAQGMDAPGVAAQRLIVDTLKWHASKLANKKYGDKLELGGGLDINNKIERITRKIVDPSGTGPRDA